MKSKKIENKIIKKNSKRKGKKKKKKAKHRGLLLSFTVQCVWVNSGFHTPFNFCYFIKFNNMTFL